MKTMSKNNVTKISVALILLLISFIFLAIFSVSTSPFFSYAESPDSAMFQLIGKYWSLGNIPYISLWDQKGPLIFFIDAVGFYFLKSSLGVFCIQILFLWADLYLIYKIFHKYGVAILSLSIIAFLISFGHLYGYGNTVEEYILPLLILGFYKQYQWMEGFYHGNISHSSKYASIYGFILAFALLTRLTNALGVCAGFGFVLITLLCYGKWSEFWKNAGSAILGFFILFLPFAAYFYYYDAFMDMWEGTFLFNVQYAKNSANVIQQGFVNFPNPASCYFLIVISSLELLFSKYRKRGIFLLVISILPVLWIWNSNGYAHYSIICVPYLLLAILEIIHIASNEDKKIVVWTFRGIGTIFLLLILHLMIQRRSNNNFYYIDGTDRNKVFAELIDCIPDSERDAFVAYEIIPTVYLYNDIKPCYKYFFFQDWHCSYDSKLTQIMRGVFNSGKAHWILIKDGYNGPLKDIFSEKYTVYRQGKYKDIKYCLLHLK